MSTLQMGILSQAHWARLTDVYTNMILKSLFDWAFELGKHMF